MAKKNKNNRNDSSSNSMFAQGLKNQLNTKHKIDERKDVNKQEVIQEQKQEEKLEAAKTQEQKGSVSKFDEQLKKEATDPKTVWKRIVFGLSFGLTSVIPTLSKSSINANVSLFDDFKSKLYGFLRPGNFYNWLLYLLWLLPIFAIAIPVFGLSFFVIQKIAEAGYGSAMLLGVAGIGIVSALAYYFTNKVPVPFKKTQFDDLKDNAKRPVAYIVTMVLGILVVLALLLVARFAWTDFPGYSLLSAPEVFPGNFIVKNFETTQALLLLAAGFMAGFVSFIPGVSSGMMLSVFGSFNTTWFATQVGFGSKLPYVGQNAELSLNWAWPIIIVVLVGYGLGLAANILFFNWISNKYPGGTKSTIFGLAIGGSLFSFIAISDADYSKLGSNGGVLATGLILFFVLMGLAALGYYLAHRYKYIYIHEKLDAKSKQI